VLRDLRLFVKDHERSANTWRFFGCPCETAQPPNLPPIGPGALRTNRSGRGTTPC